MKKILMMILVGMMAFTAFAGTYEKMTLQQSEEQYLAFNEVGKGSASFMKEVTDDLWGGFAMNVVKNAINNNAFLVKSKFSGVVTHTQLINGTDLAVFVIEMKNGQFEAADVYIFGQIQ